jgi:hypothetical protein
MRPVCVLLVVQVAVLGPNYVAAQAEICRDTDTIDDCFSRVSSRVTGEGVEDTSQTTASLEDQEAELARKPTGIAALAPGLTSAINDFLPALAGALSFTPTATEDGAAGFETNLRVPLGATLQKLRLQTVLREPTIYEPVRAALPEASREERTAALTRELGDFDDVRVSLAWNLESRTMGRSFEAQRSLYGALFRLELNQFNQRPGITQEKRRLDREAQLAYLQVMRSIRADSLLPTEGCSYDPVQVGRVKLQCLRESVRDRLVEVIARAVRAAEAVEGEFGDQLETTGFYDLADLVNNQPQLSAQLTVAIRRDLVGPNEVSGSARYEAGFANVNGLRRACQPSSGTTISLECLRAYSKAPGTQAALRRGDRFFVTASYTRRHDYVIALVDDGVAVSLAGTWDLAGELGYGRYVAFNRDGEQIGRIDLGAQYIHHGDDPNRENRFVGTATYTQRINESLSLAAGFSYASRPEFLGDVERKVGANFGLRYKLLKQ